MASRRGLYVSIVEWIYMSLISILKQQLCRRAKETAVSTWSALLHSDSSSSAQCGCAAIPTLNTQSGKIADVAHAQIATQHVGLLHFMYPWIPACC